MVKSASLCVLNRDYDGLNLLIQKSKVGLLWADGEI